MTDKTQGLTMETWKSVISAIEQSIPLYDHVNEMISLGRAQQAREYAVQKLRITAGAIVLDSGIGPGTTSQLLLARTKPSLLVGLDGSVKQLKTAKENLKQTTGDVLQVVRGSFEYLPFREKTFDAEITCYALRDSLNLTQSIREYCRVCKEVGVFADVDIGKPEGMLKRAGSSFYIQYVMPVIAKLAIRGKIGGNPWRLIVPTYEKLPTTRVLLAMFEDSFPFIQLKEFLMGGIIVVVGRRSND
ncbi:MAG TPA: class I SAM-dependent methyltransferase [Candidatus Acidoferrales bacterium]|nr:class I SAM-dependent methyltransferase [Candidatus Acidoferrales bacterium]